MKATGVSDIIRMRKMPDKTVFLVSSGSFFERGHVVKKVSLNLYIQKKYENLGPYSLITVLVETNKGVVEMTYDEGYRGINAIEEAAAFLTSHLGISGLILRSIIQLDQTLDENNFIA